MQIIRKFLLSIYFVLILIPMCIPQKVGLVLSGGGAKGLSHIGVIKALEDNEIPIDYISGTSIGAIIAGLYSIGYTTDEMELLFKSEAFEKWSKGELEDKYKYFFKQMYPNASWIELKFSNESGTKAYVPTNFVPSHQMDFAVMHIVAQAIAAANYNFDSLFVPFRCVASDIFEKKAIIFRQGDMASAIRASMAIPLYFRPIEIEDRLLFDGGIYNNFPLDVMMSDFNPDVVIGCKVASNSVKPQADDLFQQIENMVADQTNYSISDTIGVLIEPMVLNMGVLDFYKCDELIAKGYNATMSQMTAIKQLIQKRVSTDSIALKRQLFKSKYPELVFDSIKITGLKPIQHKYIINVISRKKGPADIERIKSEYFKIISDQQIESIYPVTKFNQKSGYFDIYLNLRKSKSFSTRIGGNISSSNLTQGFAELEYRHLTRRAYKLNVNSYFGKFYTSGNVTGRVDFAARYSLYLEGSLIYSRRDFVVSNPGIIFQDTRSPFTIKKERVFFVDAGIPVKVNGKFVVGYSFGNSDNEYYQSNTYQSKDTLDVLYFTHSGVHVLYHMHTLNQKQYANKGINLILQAKYVVGNELFVPGSTSVLDSKFQKHHSYMQFKFHYQTLNFKIGRTGVNFLTELVYSTRKPYRNYTGSLLFSPVFQPTPLTSTLLFENFRAFSYAAMGLGIFHKLRNGLFWHNDVYVFQPLKQIVATTDAFGETIAVTPEYFGGFNYFFSSTWVYHTVVGPFSVAINYLPSEAKRLYFNVNFGYILFNRSWN